MFRINGSKDDFTLLSNEDIQLYRCLNRAGMPNTLLVINVFAGAKLCRTSCLWMGQASRPGGGRSAGTVVKYPFGRLLKRPFWNKNE